MTIRATFSPSEPHRMHVKLPSAGEFDLDLDLDLPPIEVAGNSADELLTAVARELDSAVTSAVRPRLPAWRAGFREIVRDADGRMIALLDHPPFDPDHAARQVADVAIPQMLRGYADALADADAT